MGVNELKIYSFFPNNCCINPCVLDGHMESNPKLNILSRTYLITFIFVEVSKLNFKIKLETHNGVLM